MLPICQTLRRTFQVTGTWLIFLPDDEVYRCKKICHDNERFCRIIRLHEYLPSRTINYASSEKKLTSNGPPEGRSEHVNYVANLVSRFHAFFVTGKGLCSGDSCLDEHLFKVGGCLHAQRVVLLNKCLAAGMLLSGFHSFITALLVGTIVGC